MHETYEKLTEILKNSDNVFVMAHKNIDLDALGSSICLYEIIKSFNKECYIIIDKKEINTSIVKAKENLKKDNININFLEKDEYKKYITETSLAIILDTHKRTMVECPEVLNDIANIVVLDHHIKGGDNIENTILSLINANLSSMNELMVGYLTYLKQDIHPTIATIMLAGIEIDTNAFNVKTSITTYEAAAALARMGANNIDKQELLQENKTVYMNRQKAVLNSYKYNDNYEICVLDDMIYERKDLALIAEELLKFEDVEASFAIGKTADNIVGISARSLGRVNVEVYMSYLGGGGHTTDAAAQIKDKSIVEINEIVKRIIDEVK